jgi:hypothetical protein
MKQLYSTLGLLIVVAGVGAWIYFNERGPIAQQGSTVLLRSEPASVHVIKFQRTDGKQITLRHEGEAWHVQQGGLNAVAVPADEEAVKPVLDAVQLVQSAAVVDDTNDSKLREFGLANPQSTLLVDEAKIEFGAKPSFDQSKVYARVTSAQVGGSRVALLPANLADFANKPIDQWRDKSALRIKPDDVTKLSVRTAAMKADFERTVKATQEGELDEWQMREPVAARADVSTISTFLQQLPETKTSQFLEDNPKNLATWELDRPVAEVTLSDGGTQRYLRIGRKIPNGRAAQNSYSNAVFAVPETLLALVQRPLREWRDKAVLRFNTSEITELSVRARGGKVDLRSDLSGEAVKWKRADLSAAEEKDPRQQDKIQAAHQAALDVLLGIQGITALDFIDKPGAESTFGFDKPAIEVTLTSKSWKQPKTVQVGVANGKTYARVGEKSIFVAPVYVVPNATLGNFATALDALFPKSKKPAKHARD